MSVTVNELIDKIDEIVDEAFSIPLSRGKCMVDGEEVRNILDDLRSHLPSELNRAQEIVQDRKIILENAKTEAEDIIRRAEIRRDELTSQEEVVKEAQKKAKEILDQAQTQSRQIRRSVNDYVEETLAKTEGSLSASLSEVRSARQKFRSPAAKLEEEETASSISVEQ